jgi:hypothetical protein
MNFGADEFSQMSFSAGESNTDESNTDEFSWMNSVG